MSDELELIHTEQNPIYHRLSDEDHTVYEMFVEWCRIPPSSRNLANFTRRTGYPVKIARKMKEVWHWEVRANAFDHDSLQLRPDPTLMNDEAALAGQLAAATVLLDLGLNAIALKNPALISADKAMKLVEKGVEIQRRAMGQADLNVQFTVDDMSRVNRLVGDVFLSEGMEIPEDHQMPEPVDVIPEPDDESPDIPM